MCNGPSILHNNFEVFLFSHSILLDQCNNPLEHRVVFHLYAWVCICVCMIVCMHVSMYLWVNARKEACLKCSENISLILDPFSFSYTEYQRHYAEIHETHRSFWLGKHFLEYRVCFVCMFVDIFAHACTYYVCVCVWCFLYFWVLFPFCAGNV